MKSVNFGNAVTSVYGVQNVSSGRMRREEGKELRRKKATDEKAKAGNQTIPFPSIPVRCGAVCVKPKESASAGLGGLWKVGKGIHPIRLPLDGVYTELVVGEFSISDYILIFDIA